MGSIPLNTINQHFNNLSLGKQGAINLFRSDGVLLTRYPFLESQVNQDLGSSQHVQRLMRVKSGTFDSISPIDGVRRIISFERLDKYPHSDCRVVRRRNLRGMAAQSAGLSLATLILCCAVVSDDPVPA